MRRIPLLTAVGVALVAIPVIVPVAYTVVRPHLYHQYVLAGEPPPPHFRFYLGWHQLLSDVGLRGQALSRAAEAKARLVRDRRRIITFRNRSPAFIEELAKLEALPIAGVVSVTNWPDGRVTVVIDHVNRRGFKDYLKRIEAGETLDVEADYAAYLMRQFEEGVQLPLPSENP